MKEEGDAMCAHDWQPIPGWYARYRCSICRVIGCKFGVVNAHMRGRGTEIQPYRCEARCGGERCSEPAVHGWHGKHFRCAAHRHPGHHTAQARRELAATQHASTGVARASTAVHVASTGVDAASSAAHVASTRVDTASVEVDVASTAVDAGRTRVAAIRVEADAIRSEVDAARSEVDATRTGSDAARSGVDAASTEADPASTATKNVSVGIAPCGDRQG
jgi:hypothetical protein